MRHVRGSARRRRALLAAVSLLVPLITPWAARADDWTAPPPLRVAQVLLFDGATPADVEANLARLKEAGVDTVFVRAFQNRGDRPLIRASRPGAAVGVYFPTDAAPVVADHLAVVSAACRRLGLSVYAWMTTRACDWMLEQDPDLSELRFESASGFRNTRTA